GRAVTGCDLALTAIVSVGAPVPPCRAGGDSTRIVSAGAARPRPACRLRQRGRKARAPRHCSAAAVRATIAVLLLRATSDTGDGVFSRKASSYAVRALVKSPCRR